MGDDYLTLLPDPVRTYTEKAHADSRSLHLTCIGSYRHRCISTHSHMLRRVHTVYYTMDNVAHHVFFNVTLLCIQRPLLLKGHGRPLTRIRYNRDGDLLVTCAKDDTPNVWYTSNGERLGTYAGHQGTVWDCDISWDSTRLVTGSSDCHMKLWDMVSGAQSTHRLQHVFLTCDDAQYLC